MKTRTVHPKNGEYLQIRYTEKLVEFISLIQSIRQHPFLKNTSNYDLYIEFRKEWNNMTDMFYSIHSAYYNDKPTYEELDKLKISSETYISVCKMGAIYGAANHDINLCLQLYFRYKDNSSDELIPNFDFSRFWNETLSPFLDMFEHWAKGEDDEIPTTCYQSIYKNLKSGAKGRRVINVYKYSHIDLWRECYLVSTIEQRDKLISKYNDLINEYKEQLNITQFPDFYKDKIKTYKNRIDVLECKISNDESTWLIVDINEN